MGELDSSKVFLDFSTGLKRKIEKVRMYAKRWTGATVKTRDLVKRKSNQTNIEPVRLRILSESSFDSSRTGSPRELGSLTPSTNSSSGTPLVGTPVSENPSSQLFLEWDKKMDKQTHESVQEDFSVIHQRNVDFISKKFMKLKSNEQIPVFKYEDNSDEFEKFDLESFSANRLYNNIIDQLNKKSVG